MILELTKLEWPKDPPKLFTKQGGVGGAGHAHSLKSTLEKSIGMNSVSHCEGVLRFYFDNFPLDYSLESQRQQAS